MSPKCINTVAILILVALGLFILANSMTKPLGRDEQMYCTGGALLAQGKMIYQDFSYPSQLPYHPLLYAALFKILNTSHYLLVGRIVSSLCDILMMICIVGIYRHIFNSFRVSGTLLGLAGAVLYVFNPLVDYANGYAWNHDVVILCVALAFWLFISTSPPSMGFQISNPSTTLGTGLKFQIFLIGALLTFATCMRITTALVQLLFFAAVLSWPADSIKQRFKTALPFLIATVIVLLWPIWVIVQAPRAFFLNLYWIPKLYGKWLHEIGMIHNKIDLIISCIIKPGYLVLLIILVYLYVIFIWKHRSYKKIENRKSAVRRPVEKIENSARSRQLAALLPLIFFIIAIIPPTIWHQYLAVPVPFLIISFAYPFFYLRSSKFGVLYSVFKISCALLAVCVVITVISNPVVLYRTQMLLVPENWVPIGLHNISEEIAQETRQPKLILTLAPLFALEGGCHIYPEFSAGAIVYRIADRLTPWNRDITHTVGPRTLKKLIEQTPPSAVILGVEEPAYEEPIIETAIQPDPKKWEQKVYHLAPPLSLLTVTYQRDQQLLLLYR